MTKENIKLIHIYTGKVQRQERKCTKMDGGRKILPFHSKNVSEQ